MLKLVHAFFFTQEQESGSRDFSITSKPCFIEEHLVAPPFHLFGIVRKALGKTDTCKPDGIGVKVGYAGSRDGLRCPVGARIIDGTHPVGIGREFGDVAVDSDMSGSLE